jgi:hypothetical protein
MTRSAAPNQRGGRASSFATIKINVFAANDCAKIEWLERFDACDDSARYPARTTRRHRHAAQ